MPEFNRLVDLTGFRTAAAQFRDAHKAILAIDEGHRQHVAELGGRALYDSYYARRAAAPAEDKDAWMAEAFPEDTTAVKAIETAAGVTHHARQTQIVVSVDKLRSALIALAAALGRELMEAQQADGSPSVLDMVDQQFARANALFAEEFPMLKVRVMAEFNGDFSTTFYRELAPHYGIDPKDKSLISVVRTAAANETAAHRMI